MAAKPQFVPNEVGPDASLIERPAVDEIQKIPKARSTALARAEELSQIRREKVLAYAINDKVEKVYR